MVKKRKDEEVRSPSSFVYLTNFHHIDPPYSFPAEISAKFIASLHVKSQLIKTPCFTSPIADKIITILFLLLSISIPTIISRHSSRTVQLNIFVGLVGLFAVLLYSWRFYWKSQMETLLSNAISKFGLGDIKRKSFINFLDKESANQIYDLAVNYAGADLKHRTMLYEKCVNKLFDEFYLNEVVPPTNLIHTTCTGYISPSPPQTLVSKKNWNDATTVSQIYHMGCAASIPSIRTGGSFVKETNRRCDIVHSELTSFHMKPAINTTIQLIVEILFADGAIKYSVLPHPPQPAALHTSGRRKASGGGVVGVGGSNKGCTTVSSGSGGFKVLATHEMVIPDSLSSMTWITSNFGMDMTLSRDVPEKICKELNGFMEYLNMKAGISDFDPTKCIFAIHPGLFFSLSFLYLKASSRYP